MDIRLHSLLHRHLQHRCISAHSHDCLSISRKYATLRSHQCRQSSFKNLHRPPAPAARRATDAWIASNSFTSNSSGTIKKRGADAEPESRVPVKTIARSLSEILDNRKFRNECLGKECDGVQRELELAGVINGGSSSSREKELCKFLKLIITSWKMGNYDEGLYFLKRMVSDGYFPGKALCTKLIAGISSSAPSPEHPAATIARKDASAISKALEVMTILENYGSPDVLAYNVLLTLIRNKSGASNPKYIMELSMAVLDQMRAHGCSPNIVTYNILIGALCDLGQLDLAMEILDQLQQDDECRPTVVTYTILIEAIIMNIDDGNRNGGSNGEGFAGVIKLLEKMEANGVPPDSFTCNIILRGMCKHGLVDQAWQIVRALSKNQQHNVTSSSSSSKPASLDAISYNIVLKNLLRLKRWEDALKLISEMASIEQCKPNVVTLNTITRSLCQHGIEEKAIKVLEELMDRDLRPDTCSYVPIISTCCKQGRMDLAITIMERIHSHGYIPDITNYNIILASLCSSGAAHQALEILGKLEEMGCQPETSSYNTVIGGLWKTGDRIKALKTLSQMIDKGIHPDEVTYNTFISCLCRDGMVDHAIQLMADMEYVRGYLPTVITYNIIILGLCKLHRIDTAVDILEQMVGRECMPNGTTYLTLVRGLACAGYGEEAAEVGTALISCKAVSWDSIRKLKRILPKPVNFQCRDIEVMKSTNSWRRTSR